MYGAGRYAGSVRYCDGVVESRGPDREYVERRGHLRIGTADVVDVNDYSGVRATRESQPAVKEPPRQRESQPEAPKDAQRPEPKPRGRDSPRCE